MRDNLRLASCLSLVIALTSVRQLLSTNSRSVPCQFDYRICLNYAFGAIYHKSRLQACTTTIVVTRSLYRYRIILLRLGSVLGRAVDSRLYIVKLTCVKPRIDAQQWTSQMQLQQANHASLRRKPTSLSTHERYIGR